MASVPLIQGCSYDDVTGALTGCDPSVFTGDISLASTSPQPTLNTTSIPNSGTSDVSSFLNSAGAFGVAIASIMGGGTQTQIVPVTSSTVRPATATSGIGGLLLLGLGIFLVVKLMK